MATLKNLQLDTATLEIETGLQNWSKPALIIWGTADKWLDVAKVQNLTAANTNITFVEFPEAKHYPQEHWASEIAEEITQFFRRKVF